MRHSAWLGAVPEAAPGARADAAKLSRRERIERDGGEIEMPPFDEGEYLIAYLYELGPTVAVSRRLTTPQGEMMVTVVGEIPIGTAERIALSMRTDATATK